MLKTTLPFWWDDQDRPRRIDPLTVGYASTGVPKARTLCQRCYRTRRLWKSKPVRIESFCMQCRKFRIADVLGWLERWSDDWIQRQFVIYSNEVHRKWLDIASYLNVSIFLYWYSNISIYVRLDSVKNFLEIFQQTHPKEAGFACSFSRCIAFFVLANSNIDEFWK